MSVVVYLGLMIFFHGWVTGIDATFLIVLTIFPIIPLSVDFNKRQPRVYTSFILNVISLSSMGMFPELSSLINGDYPLVLLIVANIALLFLIPFPKVAKKKPDTQ
ncbi:hypothetical protein ACUY3K_06505 [Corynebacterium uberis]|uniref:hypothetical protein n=1 Tax=Corynebacterium TaxID=1716 RepID=UPI001D0BB89F|nr:MULTISPECIES: hypothetical protein [Corynebacterium]UDL75258.1 hypothetical protein LH393_08335 [Corynebacterium uberis]UDL84097.1 hypothetical protein LH390_08325 [Corynebacterium uberis]